MAVGTTTIDFGPAPGNTKMTVTIADPTILTGGYAECMLMGDTTADHNAAEHEIRPLDFVCGTVVNATGFNVEANSNVGRLTGLWKIRWVSF